jgi:hypothetical protein
MAERELPTEAAAASTRAAKARSLAERGLHEQAAGHLAEADRLLSQAQDMDPDAVAEVLREHDAGRAPEHGCRTLPIRTWRKLCPGSSRTRLDAAAPVQRLRPPHRVLVCHLPRQPEVPS